MSRQPSMNVTLTPGDIDFIEEMVDFLQEILSDVPDDEDGE